METFADGLAEPHISGIARACLGVGTSALILAEENDCM